MEFNHLYIDPRDHMGIAAELIRRFQIFYYKGYFYEFNGKYWDEISEDDLYLRIGDIIHSYNESKLNSVARILRAKSKEIIPNNYEGIPLLNGIYMVEKNKLVHYKPEFRVIQIIPIVYDAQKQCPMFNNYLNSCFDGDTDKIEKLMLLQEFAGYCLLQNTGKQKALYLVGEGCNGKSVFLDILKGFLGQENVNASDLVELTDKRYTNSIQNKYLNICDDLDFKQQFNEGIFKTIVAGGLLTAAPKYKSQYSFSTHCKLVFSANGLPQTKDTSFGYHRRWLFVNFNRIIPANERIENLANMILEAEKSGILNWAIAGLKRLLQDGFTIPASTLEINEKYKARSSSVLSFIKHSVWEKPNERILKTDLYNAYNSFCITNNLKAKSSPNFFDDFFTHVQFAEKIKSNGYWYIKNITISEKEPE